MKRLLLALVVSVISQISPSWADEVRSPAFDSDALTRLPTENWITTGGNLSNQRYSPLEQINKTNVAGLKGVWRTHLDGSGLGPQYSGEAQPLVYQGVVYISTGADDVFAVSVKTGAIIWKYVANLENKIATICCGWTNRGVALGDGRVYLGQLDGKLIALDQQTGQVLWSIQAERWQDGYTITSAPLYFEGLVITGFAGAEFATRGRLKAYDAKTGELVWTFYSVPAPGEPGHETWPAGSDIWRYGGGNIWTTPAIDPELGLIYFGTANPGGDFNGSIRPGDNLFTGSIVAIDAKTGRYKWHFQAIHHDLWDYDVSNPPILFDAEISGQMRRGVAAAGKTGWIYILDRATGEPLIGIEERPVPQDPRQRTSASQPYPIGDAFVPQEIDIAPEGHRLTNKGRIFTPFWVDGSVVKPASRGGSTWPPSSLDPKSATMFVCATDRVQYFVGGDRGNEPEDWKEGDHFIGTESFRLLDQVDFGVFAAMDLKTNRLVWQQRWNDACYSGSATTAAGLVFVGRNDGRMTALDASDGKRLWEFQTGAGVNAPPTVFEFEGKQYVVVLTAGNLFARSARGDSLWLFGLDGALDPVPPAQSLVPPRAAATESHGPALVSVVPIAIPSVLKGRELRATRATFEQVCAACHGPRGGGTANGISLRDAPRDSEKSALVIQQGRNNMPPFAETMTATEIGRLAAYVAMLGRDEQSSKRSKN